MRVLARLLLYVRPYLGQMIAGMVLLAFAGGLMSAILAIGKPLVNYVLLPAASPAVAPAIPGGLGWGDRWLPAGSASAFSSWFSHRPYVRVPVLMVLVFFVRGVVVYFGQYLTARAGLRVIRDVRARLHEAVTYQSLRFFQANPTGVLVSRILNDVQRLQRVSTDVLADLVRVGAMVPFTLILVLVHDWRISLFTLVALPLMVYPILRLGDRLRRASTRSQESMGEVTSLLTETVAGVRVVQGFSMERFEVSRFRAALDRMLRADLKAGRAAALAPAVLELVAGLAGAALFYLAGREIAQHRIDPGDFVVVLSGLVLLFMSLRRMNQLNAELQQAVAAATRVFDLMDRERDVRDTRAAVDLPRFEDAIRVESVGFAYDGEKVLDGIDLTIRKGEVVALVGVSGSGKSTLANLVPRFFDPSDGRITVDGRDLRDVTLASLRGQIGLVTQETILFDDTARNNIAYGCTDVPLERVVEVARAAQAHEFIERLPQGYDTVLGESGSRLSMGQRQRITIARALLKNPPILILDEATSALDAESETLVQQALEVLMKGRTSIVIAHRLATVRRADRIVVLEGGRIVEEGGHRELLERGGVYARLHELQFQESAP